ncbi:MAG: alcohol dehydrogenase catalytic domain-containing protein [Microthrixaceae bacterium]
MKAYRLLEWGRPPELVEVDTPAPGPGEVLVAVAGNGLCHSDLTMMAMPAEVGDALGWRVPFTLGHEVAGHVVSFGGPGTGDPHDAEAVGSVTGETVALGDAVALMSTNSCGRCRACRAGRDSLCAESLVGRGYGWDGGLAEFVVAPLRDCVPLGDLDPATAGVLTDAAATAYHGVERVLARLDSLAVPRGSATVVVVGAGGVGGFCVQELVALGVGRVVAVEIDPLRRAGAVELGASIAIASADRSGRDELRALLREGVGYAPGASRVEPSGHVGPGSSVGSDRADAVLDVVGTDDTIRFGLAVLAPGGSFGLVGDGGGSLAAPWFSGLPREAEVFTFQGSRRRHVAEVVQLARQGRLSVRAEQFGLDDVDRAYELLRRSALAGRAVVTPRTRHR